MAANGIADSLHGHLMAPVTGTGIPDLLNGFSVATLRREMKCRTKRPFRQEPRRGYGFVLLVQKRRQGDGFSSLVRRMVDLGLACLVSLPLRHRTAEPVLETRRAEARMIAGREALIVHLDAEVAGVGVRDHLSAGRGWRSGIVGRVRPCGSVRDRPARSCRSAAAPTATSASAAATSSDTMGCIRAGGSRTVCPSVADWAMPPTNSKNCVARTIV